MSSTQQRNRADLRFILRPVSSGAHGFNVKSMSHKITQDFSESYPARISCGCFVVHTLTGT